MSIICFVLSMYSKWCRHQQLLTFHKHMGFKRIELLFYPAIIPIIPQERANSTSTPPSLLSHFIQRNGTKIRIKYHSIKEKRRKNSKWFKNPRFFQSSFSSSLSTNTKSSFKMGGLEPVFLLTKQFLFSYQQ